MKQWLQGKTEKTWSYYETKETACIKYLSQYAAGIKYLIHSFLSAVGQWLSGWYHLYNAPKYMVAFIQFI